MNWVKRYYFSEGYYDTDTIKSELDKEAVKSRLLKLTQVDYPEMSLLTNDTSYTVKKYSASGMRFPDSMKVSSVTISMNNNGLLISTKSEIESSSRILNQIGKVILLVLTIFILGGILLSLFVNPALFLKAGYLFVIIVLINLANILYSDQFEYAGKDMKRKVMEALG